MEVVLCCSHAAYAIPRKGSRIHPEDKMTLHSEIFEQPQRLVSLLVNQKQIVYEIAKTIRSRNVQYAFLAARGTSDNAGRYANYLWGAHNQLPLALATPSLFTYYQSPPRLQNALVVGISQSGQSPDIVSVLEEGRKVAGLLGTRPGPEGMRQHRGEDGEAGQQRCSQPCPGTSGQDKERPAKLGCDHQPGNKPSRFDASQVAHFRDCARKVNRFHDAAHKERQARPPRSPRPGPHAAKFGGGLCRPPHRAGESPCRDLGRDPWHRAGGHTR